MSEPDIDISGRVFKQKIYGICLLLCITDDNDSDGEIVLC